ncbi:MAG: deoxyguanosinetriphosphate triphosphohydrolase [Cyclobacteriaceae bacterium]|nr:deoxyguanosinetriphosphate triphosphohydrolase [Cyclobacteriaceae bacterium]
MNWNQLLSSTRLGSNPAGNTKVSFRKDSEKERSNFEADYDRIIFSYPFRRLQDKTQVFPLPEQDFVHNRLTHSLEVSSVGRTLGKRAGEKLIDRHNLTKITASDFGTIVSAAALAHDVGNPPFGHSGEESISSYFQRMEEGAWLKVNCSNEEWADLENFEGNAQGFRLINQKEQGLTLTYATLGAFTKYPKRSSNPKVEGRVSQKKFGFYQTEQVVFEIVAEELGLHKFGDASYARHPLAFLVEAADDICYNIIDLEDGCTLGLISLDETIELLKPIVGERFDADKLAEKKFLHEKLGTLRALAINELIAQSVDVFLINEEAMLTGEFDTSLTDLIPAAEALAKIKDISIQKIYRAQIVVEKEVAGYEVLNGLLEILMGSLIGHLQEKPTKYHKMIRRTLPDFIQEASDRPPYEATRIMLDYISGMTDKHALTSYRKLKGMVLPSW